MNMTERDPFNEAFYLQNNNFTLKAQHRYINPLPLRQTQRSPEGPRHLHRIPRLSEAPREVP